MLQINNHTKDKSRSGESSFIGLITSHQSRGGFFNMEHHKNLSLEDLQNEEWRPIPNTNNIYFASNFGRIKSYRNNRPKILSQSKCPKNGYLRLGLGANIHTYGHILVARAFFGEKPSPNAEVNHINFITFDNRVENLEWSTIKDNRNHSRVNGRYDGTLSRCGCSSARMVNQYTLDGVLVKTWDCLRDTEEDGFDSSAVSKCARGVYKHHHGYIFKYLT